MAREPSGDIMNDHGEMYEHFRFEVDPGQSPLRIDKFLVSRIENLSRNRIQNAAAAGNVLVNDKEVKSNYKVKPGDVISIVLAYPPREKDLVPEDITIEVIYEDEHLIVINKEAGMVVHPGHGNFSGTLVNALAWRFRDIPLFRSGELRPGLVHRIDKNTSGIIVVAKTELAMNRLARQFYNREIKRKYTALVWGNPEPAEGTITGSIGRHPTDRIKMHVFKNGSEGKYAVTHYRVVEKLGYVNLVECELETGRTHQIRVHFEYMGNPLFNDERYGGNRILKGTTFTKYRQFVQNCFRLLPRHALHAQSLGFIHPLTGEKLFFETDLPEDMKMVLEKWRKYLSGRDI